MILFGLKHSQLLFILFSRLKATYLSQRISVIRLYAHTNLDTMRSLFPRSCLMVLMVSMLLLQVGNAGLVETQLSKPETPTESSRIPQEPRSDLSLVSSTPRSSNKKASPQLSSTLIQFLNGENPKSLGIPLRRDSSIIVGLISEEKPSNWIVPPAPFGKNYFSLVAIERPQDLVSILSSSKAIMAYEWKKAPKDVFLQNEIETSNAVTNATFDPLEIMDVRKVWIEQAILGTGVSVGVVDSGVDFGNTDLSSRIHREDGQPSSFDPSGAGIVLTPVEVSPVVIEGRKYLPLSNLSDFPVWTGENFALINSSQLGIQLEDLEIEGISAPSVSGTYRFGIGYEVIGQYATAFLAVLSDAQVANVYDTLYIDMDTSLALSLVQSGLIFEGGRTYRQLVDWSLSDDESFIWGERDILAKDSNGDGIYDVSFGSLGNTIDLYGIINGELISGILSSGEGFAVMYDYFGHGTSTSASVAGTGASSYPIFDNPNTEEVENDTTYSLPGTAPNASIIAAKFYSIADIFSSWYWVLGFEPDYALGEWVYTGLHKATIVSNSFGLSDPNVLGYARGLDPLTMFVDLASQPGLLDPLFDGALFVVSSGNSGPGPGTAATPGVAGTALTVGASTFEHFREFSEKTPQSDSQAAMFSSRGPSPLFLPKPDVVSVGSFWYAPTIVMNGKGNGTRAFWLFSGTSEAAPLVAGVAALVVEAMKNVNINPTPALIKQAILLGSRDLGFPSQIQGAGIVNATLAISMAKTYQTSILFGDGTRDYGKRTNPAFESFFGISNPLRLASENLVGGFLGYGSSKTLTLSLANVSSLEATYYSASLYETLEGFTEGKQSTYVTLLTQNNFSSDVAGFRISFSFANDSWNAILQSDTQDPFEFYVIDWVDKNGNGKVDEPSSISFSQGERIYLAEYTGYSQKTTIDVSLLHYVPKGNLVFLLVDPDGVANGSLNSRNFGFQIDIYAFEKNTLPNSIISLGTNTLTLNASSGEAVFGNLRVSTNQATFSLPISMFNLPSIPLSGNTSMRYLDEIFNSPKYSFGNPNFLSRPDQGDTYYFSFTAPSGADLIPIIVSWKDPTTVVDVYLANETGSVVKTSDIRYIGGGQFRSGKSEATRQLLLYRTDPLSPQTFLIILHVTSPSVKLAYDSVSLIVRALYSGDLPPVGFSLDPSTKQVTGILNIRTPIYKVSDFPELELKQLVGYLEATRLQQQTISISAPDPNPGAPDEIFELFLNSSEYVNVKATFENAGLTGNMIIQVFYEDDDPLPQNDLLEGTGMQYSTNIEFGFLAPKTGKYFFYIDLINATGVDLRVSLSISKSLKFTIPFDGTNGTIDTRRLPDANYSLTLNYITNFVGLTFESTITREFVNPRSLRIQSLNNLPETDIKAGSTLEFSVNLAYSGSLDIRFIVYLFATNNDSSWLQLGIFSTNAISVEIPKTLTSGKYILRVVATDGIIRDSTQSILTIISATSAPLIGTSFLEIDNYLIALSILAFAIIIRKRTNS